jgi:hypothetical protein
MSTIASDRHVFISMLHDGSRWWLTAVQTDQRPRTGDLYLRGTWEKEDATRAKSFTYATADVIRRRLAEESRIATQISFTAGDASEFIEEQVNEPARTEKDDRKPKPVWDAAEKCFRLAEPGHTPRGPRWFVKLFDKDGNHANSAWGDSPQEAFDIARASKPLVMKRYQSAAPKQEIQAAPATRPPRLRPGDRF